MASRGRVSLAALSVVKNIPGQRPEPPDELSDLESKEWRAIVSRMPADWFPRETHPLLSALCGHIASQKSLSDRIRVLQESPDDEALKTYAALLAMRNRESRTIAAISTKLRLTQQSRYNAQSANTAAARGTGTDNAARPWSVSCS